MENHDWRETYKNRTVSAAQAVDAVYSGSRVFISAGCGRPQALVDELMRPKRNLADIELIHLATIGLAPYTGSEYKDRFRHNALFIGSNVSEAIDEGRADYTPISKLQIAKLFRSGRVPLDVAMIQVTPPNDLGFVSMGVTVGISKTAAECAEFVIAQVNPNMPRTMGDSFLHVSEIDAFVIDKTPLVEAPDLEPDPVTDRIAYHCARLIEDGAVLHLGYSQIAFAMAKYLYTRRDLGVHTDVLTAPIIDLMKRGVITNTRKTLNPKKTITSLCYGNAEIYQFVNDNPHIEFHPCEYVNDPFVISRNDRMIAVNEAHNVDLTGLVGAKFVGPRFGGGFMVGATHSERGKSIAVLPATSPDGTESNIVPFLESGLGLRMSTSREDVQYVVTEYGIAALYGRTIRERALALIHVAHPKFRAQLMEAAKQGKYVHQDQLLSAQSIYPDQFEHWHKLDSGTKLFVRPARPADERMVQSFVYKLDEKSIQYRFHGSQHKLDHAHIQHFVNVDYDETFTLLAFLMGERDHKEVIGMAQYLFYPAINQAEVAFITADEYQSQGIGTHLLRYLIRIAREKKIEKFFAEVMLNNHGMLKVFHKSQVPLTSHLEDGVYNVTLDIAGDAE